MRVAMVDDETAARASMSQLIRSACAYDLVGEAENGQQALILAAETHPDVMLIDIGMPDMSGLELLRQLKQKHPEIVAIMLTMHREFTYAVEAMRLGAVDYLIKDAYDGTQLFRALERVRGQLKEKGLSGCENEIETLAASNQWEGMDGRIARFLGTKRPEKVFEGQRQWLEHIGFTQMQPIEPDLWLAQGHPDDGALCERTRATAQGRTQEIVFSKTLHSVSQDAIRGFLLSIGERFYDDGKVIVSSAPYDGIFSQSTHARLFKDFSSFMLTGEEGFFTALRQECMDKRISPDNLRTFLLSCMQDWCGSSDQWSEETEEMRNTLSMRDAELLLRSFSLKQRLEPEYGKRMEMQKLKQYIRDHLSEDLSLPSLAEKINYSPAYLSMLFKKQTGEGLKRYIVETRLSAAVEMLRCGRLKVYEIAAACGFPNVRYFSSVFFEAYGMNPRQYREQMPHE